MKLEVDFKGLKELDKAIRALGAETGAKIYRGAAMDAMEPVKQEILANAPVSNKVRFVKNKAGEKIEIRPGFLKSRTKKRSRVNRKGTVNRNFKEGGILRVRAGVFRVPYIGSVEYGAPGNNVAAQPFIEQALGAKRSEVISVFRQKAGIRYERAAKRAAKKAGSLRKN